MTQLILMDSIAQIQQTSSEQFPPEPTLSPSSPLQTQLNKPLSTEPPKPKSKLRKILLFVGVLLLLSSVCFGYLIYQSHKSKIDNQSKEKSSEETTTIGWKVNKCISDGFEISYPENMYVHNLFPGETSCPREYDFSSGSWPGPISLYPSNQKISEDKDKIIESENEVTINGINAKYLKASSTTENQKFLIYEYPGNGKYYRLTLKLYSYDSRQDVDFYKESQWDEFVNEYNKSQNPNENTQITQTDITNIFHKMAQTFVLTIPPSSTPLSPLENCLKTARKNFDDNEIKISKPSGTPGSYYYSGDDYDVIYLQYKKEVNLCYRASYKEQKATNKCLESNQNDTDKEYDCYTFHLQIM